MPRTIDAHHHFWSLADRAEQTWRGPGHDAIARDFQPGDLRPLLSASGVDATVLVQAAETPAENDRLAAYVAETDIVAGAVGWLPVTDPERARAELRRLAGRDGIRGVRCGVGRAPLGDLAAGAVGELFAELAASGLSWDIVAVTDEHADAVVRLADAVPGLRIIVDHLARPPLDGGDRRVWADRVRALADRPNVALKVSVGIDVLTTGWSWDRDALTWYVEHAVRCFGPDRLMLSSNWPVVLLGQEYTTVWRDLSACVRATGVSGADLDQVLGGTAARWYRLDS